MEENCFKCFSCWDVLVWICRIWSIVTALLLWGVGVEICFWRNTGFHIGYLLIIDALVMSFFEAVFVVIFWIDFIKKDEKTCCTVCWRKGFGFIDDWKKGVLYITLSSLCFIEPKSEWVAVIPGCMMILSGVLYCVKTLKTQKEAKEEEQRAKNQTYGRFNTDVEEDIEDNGLAGVGGEAAAGGPVYPAEEGEEEEGELTIGDQDEILDV